jgi:hypothetical protein
VIQVQTSKLKTWKRGKKNTGTKKNEEIKITPNFLLVSSAFFFPLVLFAAVIQNPLSGCLFRKTEGRQELYE